MSDEIRAWPDIIGGIKDGVADAFHNAAQSFSEGVAEVVRAVLGYVTGNGVLALEKSWFVEKYERVLTLSLYIILALFVISLIQAALQRQPGLMARAVARTAWAVWISFMGLSLLATMIVIVDQATAAVIGGEAKVEDSVADQIADLPDTVGDGLSFVMALVWFLMSLVLFLIRQLRDLALLATAVFIPLYASGLLTDVTSTWLKRAGEIMLALLLTPFVVLIIMDLGNDMLTQGEGSLGSAILDALNGIILMVVACCSPLGLMYIIGFAEGMVTAHMQSAASSARSGAAALKGQARGHNSRGGRTLGGRLTGRGRSAVSSQGGDGMERADVTTPARAAAKGAGGLRSAARRAATKVKGRGGDSAEKGNQTTDSTNSPTSPNSPNSPKDPPQNPPTDPPNNPTPPGDRPDPPPTPPGNRQPPGPQPGDPGASTPPESRPATPPPAPTPPGGRPPRPPSPTPAKGSDRPDTGAPPVQPAPQPTSGDRR